MHDCYFGVYREGAILVQELASGGEQDGGEVDVQWFVYGVFAVSGRFGCGVYYCEYVRHWVVVVLFNSRKHIEKVSGCCVGSEYENIGV